MSTLWALICTRKLLFQMKTTTSSLQCQLFQQDNLQFLQGPSVQGSGKPQGRRRGFRLKTGEGRDESQSKEGGCKHCNEVTTVKLTPESILLPTSREGHPRHGRTGDKTDQYGLQKADKTKYDWNPIRYSLTWRSGGVSARTGHCLLKIGLPGEVAGPSGKARRKAR